ncbi:hypothetical protein ABH903_002588 [Brevibacterium epidermidis]|uniref:Gram-positive cocci surface proteins LPxTG domain-containing protein n=1 Tax=Brevibacterium epidermidis TaxID=1698 RepID=A0ABV4EMS1_BREEP|nr:LPXTG cell wall anchor domain-containing protein [Brevibacterium epidermidis]
MKRLAMAATFALALSLSGWSPAVAQADEGSLPTNTDIQAAGEAGTADTDPADTDAPPADPSDGTADTDEGTTDPDGGTTDPDEGTASTDPDEDSTAPGEGEEDADPDENADEPTEDSAPIEASFSLDQTSMTVDEAAEAIPYTITGLKAGDTVTASPGENGSITVDSDGTFHGELRGNTELTAGSVLDVTVTVARDGQDPKTFNGSVEITDAEDSGDASLSVDPKTQGLDRFHNDGVGLTVSGCPAGEEVTFTVRRSGEETIIWEDTQHAVEDGTSFTTFTPGTGGDEWIGNYAVTADCGDATATASFTVTEDDDSVDADLTVTPKTQTLSDFFEHGVNITLVNCHVDSDVTFRVSTLHDPDTEIWSETQTAGEDAAGYARFLPDGDGGAGWATDYLVMASCGDKSAETTFTVTDDGSVVDPKLSISPETISGEDFIDRDQGVQLMVNKCVPDTDVHFEVWSEGKEEKLYEQTATANEEGAAGIHVYGLGDDPAYYVGTYQVFADCMDVSRSGEFVVTGGDGGDSGEAGGSGGGSSMPRTGAELTGLTAGALLILGGGAAIGLARRKNKS